LPNPVFEGKKKDLCDFESCSEVNLWDGVIILMLSKMFVIDP